MKERSEPKTNHELNRKTTAYAANQAADDLKTISYSMQAYTPRL
jgi:hypothetical protein